MRTEIVWRYKQWESVEQYREWLCKQEEIVQVYLPGLWELKMVHAQLNAIRLIGEELGAISMRADVVPLHTGFWLGATITLDDLARLKIDISEYQNEVWLSRDDKILGTYRKQNEGGLDFQDVKEWVEEVLK